MICFLFFSEQAKIKAEDECENKKESVEDLEINRHPEKREKLFIYLCFAQN